MNIRRKIISAFFAFILLFSSTGCDIADDLLSGLLVPEASTSSGHTHTFYKDWEFNEHTHYHAASCGHDVYSDKSAHDFSSWDTIREANEYQEGLKERYCFVCGYEQTETIKYIPPHTHSYEISAVVTPTCGNQGYTKYTCECGDSYKTNIKPALPHTFDTVYSYNENYHWFKATCGHTDAEVYVSHKFEETIITEATESTEGYGYKECLTCFYSTYFTIPKKEHIHDYQPVFNWNMEDHEKLTVSFVCSYDETHTLPTYSYSYWYNFFSISEPSCENSGHYQYQATAYYNGNYYYDTYDYYPEATGHSFYEYYSYDTINHWRSSSCWHYLQADFGEHDFEEKVIIAPTETGTGESLFECKTCDYYEYVITSPLNHVHNYTPQFNWDINSDEIVTVKVACSEYKHHVLDPKDYNFWYEIVDQKEANCGESGYIRYIAYVTIGETLYSEEYYLDLYVDHTYEKEYSYNDHYHWIDATCGHDVQLNYGNHNIYNYTKKEPTYYEEGEGYAYCYTCPFSYNYTIPALNTTHEYYPVFTWSNHPGEPLLNVEIYCTICEDHKVSPHEFNYWYNQTHHISPTCDKEGSVYYEGIVTYDGKYYYDQVEFTLPKAEHKISDSYNYNDQYHWKSTNCSHNIIEQYEKHDLKETIVKEPTETDYGLVSKYCETCGFRDEQSLAPLTHVHNYYADFNFDYNREEVLTVTFRCSSDYKHILDENEYEYWYEVVKFIEPTCEEDGYVYYSGYAIWNAETFTSNFEFFIPKLNHTYESEYSYDEHFHWYNTTCGHESKGSLNNHNYTEKIVKHPTDEEEGQGIASCMDCSYSYEYTIPKTNSYHNYVPEFKWDITSDMILNVSFKCTSCDNHYLDEHEYIFWYETYQYNGSNCYYEGWAQFKGVAKYNGNIYEEMYEVTIPMTDHNYRPYYSYDVHNHWKDTQCGHYGKKDIAPHDLVQTVITEPTEYSDGQGYESCKTCDYEGYYTISSLSHIHEYYPSFIWDFENENQILDVKFYCTSNSKHILDRNEYDYWYEIIEQLDPTCSIDGHITYRAYAVYNEVTFENDMTHWLGTIDHPWDENYSSNTYYHWIGTQCEHNERMNYGNHFFNITTIKEATAYESGEGFASCDTCGYSYNFIIYPTSETHSYNPVFNWNEESNKNYYEILTVDFVCECKESHKLYPHQYTYYFNLITSVDPSCEEGGYYYYEAYAYNYFDYISYENGFEYKTPANGHSFSDWYYYDSTHHWKDAWCGHSDIKGEYAEHDIEHTITSEPDEYNSGTGYGKCKTCDYGYYYEIPAGHEHDYNVRLSWDNENISSLKAILTCSSGCQHEKPFEGNLEYTPGIYVAPTCTENGYQDYSVTVYYNGEYYELLTKVISATGHQYDDNDICTKCFEHK